MAAPVWAITPVASAEQAATITFTKPSVVDGDVLVVALRSQGTRSGEIVLPSGWSRGGSGTVPNDRALGIFYKAIPTASAESATSYTFGGLSSSTSRVIGSIGVLRGADLTALNDGGVAYDTDATLPATTAGGVPYTVIALWGAEFTSGVSVVPSSTPSGFTTVLNAQTAGGSSPSTVVANSNTTGSRTGMVLASREFQSGSTSVASLTTAWPAAPTDPKSAVWIVRGKATATVPRGFNNVAEMAATKGATWAHRGGSASYPEHSLYAYQQAAARGYGALELSMQRTSDGVWFGCHDLTLARVTGNAALTQDVRTMTWAQVNSYQITVGAQGAPQPFMRWQDFIAAGFGNTHVLILDPKNSVDGNQTEFFNMVAADVSKDRVLMKWSGGLTTFATAAKAAGFQTAGYWYQTDYDNGNLAAQASSWDWLGMDLTATTAWTGPGNVVELAASQGKKVWGHIAQSPAEYNTAMSKRSDVVQSAAVASITAVGPTALNGPGSLVLSVSASRAVDVSRSAVGALSLGGSATRVVDVARSTSGSLILDGTASRSVDAGRAAVGSLSLDGTAPRTIDTTRDAPGELSIAGAASVTVNVTRTATGALMLGGAGILDNGGVVRTATGVLNLSGTASRAVDTSRASAGGLVITGTATRTVSMARAAIGSLALSGVGVLDREPVVLPGRLTLTEVSVNHTLTDVSVKRTLEDA